MSDPVPAAGLTPAQYDNLANITNAKTQITLLTLIGNAPCGN
jgi:hypothetical protein